MTRIVAALPGRLRIRDAALRRSAVLQALQERIAVLPGVLELRANAAAASLVLHYDSGRVEPQLMQQQLEDVLAQLLGVAPTPKAPQPAHAGKSARPRRLLINRLAKFGMLTSLGSSLALAAAGSKRWHIGTGMLFVACLGVHLTTHRKQLLR